MLVDKFSLEGLNNTLKGVDEIRSNPRYNPGLEIAGILLTQYEANQRLSKMYRDQLSEVAQLYGTRLFDTCIRRSVKVREAQVSSESLFAHAPSCTTAADYRAWVDELERMELVS